jgi:hypothetical protein
MVSLLERPHSPMVISTTSILGSIERAVDSNRPPLDLLPYISSKAALNSISTWYPRRYPKWKVDACCPGLNAAEPKNRPLTKDNHPRYGATNAVRVAVEEDSQPATYTIKEAIPW